MQRTLEIQLREAEQVGASHMGPGAHGVAASFSFWAAQGFGCTVLLPPFTSGLCCA